MTCQCETCKTVLHKTDCAVHNEPAMPKGECDCGARVSIFQLAHDLIEKEESQMHIVRTLGNEELYSLIAFMSGLGKSYWSSVCERIERGVYKP